MSLHFDTMSDAELMSFWSRYQRASRKAAAELVGDRRPGFTIIAATLAKYALNLAVARKCRADGDECGFAIYMHAVGLCTERLPADIRKRMWEGDRKATVPQAKPKPIGHVCSESCKVLP